MGRNITRRFWEKVDVSSGCWEWQATTISRGYGYFWVGSSDQFDSDREYSHRVAYELFCGDICDGEYVLHSCDNPKCVNPDHLRTGTQEDNMRDAMEKDRMVLPELPDNSGEKHGGSKLTEAEAIDVKTRYKNETASEVASDYPISEATVRAIGQGKRWGHLEDA